MANIYWEAINLNHGDGVIYLGIEDEHSRKELDTDYHAQIFYIMLIKTDLTKCL